MAAAAVAERAVAAEKITMASYLDKQSLLRKVRCHNWGGAAGRGRRLR